ncbi:MAG: enoyl-CoA hydratase-related protein [Alphaproteobacteria bacterium]
MSGKMHVEEHDGVVHVINDHPGTRNSLSYEFITGFRDLLESYKEGNVPGAVVLSGADGFFCSGGNLSGLKERSEGDYEKRRSNVDRLHAMVRAIRACPCPVIAAVEGGAAGAGAALALSCDLVYGAEDAYFSVAYVRIGITPDGGTTHFMNEAIPRWLLAELAFTGDKVPLSRLYQLGAVNAITPKGDAVSTALQMAKRLAEGPRGAIAQTKKLISSGRQASLDEQLDDEAHQVAEALGSPDGKEGILAFLEKRKAIFNQG